MLLYTLLIIGVSAIDLLPLGNTLGLQVLNGGHAVISPNIIANVRSFLDNRVLYAYPPSRFQVLGPSQCSKNQLVGVKTGFNLLGLNLLAVCACVEVVNVSPIIYCTCSAQLIASPYRRCPTLRRAPLALLMRLLSAAVPTVDASVM